MRKPWSFVRCLAVVLLLITVTWPIKAGESLEQPYIAGGPNVGGHGADAVAGCGGTDPTDLSCDFEIGPVGGAGFEFSESYTGVWVTPNDDIFGSSPYIALCAANVCAVAGNTGGQSPHSAAGCGATYAEPASVDVNRLTVFVSSAFLDPDTAEVCLGAQGNLLATTN